MLHVDAYEIVRDCMHFVQFISGCFNDPKHPLVMAIRSTAQAHHSVQSCSSQYNCQ